MNQPIQIEAQDSIRPPKPPAKRKRSREIKQVPAKRPSLMSRIVVAVLGNAIFAWISGILTGVISFSSVIGFVAVVCTAILAGLGYTVLKPNGENPQQTIIQKVEDILNQQKEAAERMEKAVRDQAEQTRRDAAERVRMAKEEAEAKVAIAKRATSTARTVMGVKRGLGNAWDSFSGVIGTMGDGLRNSFSGIGQSLSFAARPLTPEEEARYQAVVLAQQGEAERRKTAQARRNRNARAWANRNALIAGAAQTNAEANAYAARAAAANEQQMRSFLNSAPRGGTYGVAPGRPR